MPRNTQAARRYANALYQMTQDKNDSAHFGEPSKVLRELESLDSAIEKDAMVSKFFTSPVISKEEKREAISELKILTPLTQRFLTTLIDAGRFDIFKEIVIEFRGLLEQSSGELTADLVTAHPTSEKEIESIKKILQQRWKREVKVTPRVDPSIIGGFVAKAPGKIFDASVATQLDALKQQVLG